MGMSEGRPNPYKIITIKSKKLCIKTCIWPCYLNIILGCFWAQDPPRGGPGDHAGMRTPTIMKKKKTCFETLFLRPIWNSFACFCNVVFFNVFWTSRMLDFFSQGDREGSILKHLGDQMQHVFAKYGKMKNEFSLERGHQNQAFQGLCFTAIYGLPMRAVETCTFFPSAEGLWTLYSISPSIWPSFLTPKLP